MMPRTTSLLSLLFLGFVALAHGFSSPASFRSLETASSSSTRLLSKKNPQGMPITVQEDEDMAMWVEGADGKREKALKAPVGGRPINKLTKDMIQGRAAKKNKPWWQK